MADPSRYADSKPDTGRRWLKVAGIVAVVLVLLVVVVMLIGGGGGGGEHGPGRHSQAPPSSVAAELAPTAGVH